MSYDLRGFARRVKNRSRATLEGFAPKWAGATVRQAAATIRATLLSSAPLVREDRFAPVLRRVDILERNVAREIDRARELEGAAILANRSASDAVSAAIERRSSVLAERIVVLQRDLDAYRLASTELSREVWSEKPRTTAALEGVEATRRSIAEVRAALEQTTSDIGDSIGSIVKRLDALTENVQALNEAHRSIAELRQALEQTTLDIGQSIGSVVLRLDGLTENVQGLNASAPDLANAVNTTAAGLQELVNRHRAIPFMTKPIFPATPKALGSNGSFDYVGFEDIFRGPKSLVRDRQRAYVQFMREGQRIVDLGCGRGEFLELAREAGAHAIGVDRNAEMVARCLESGFDVHEADAVCYLQNVPAGSLDMIFSAQFIEHITPDELNTLFVAARHALAPGGMLIAETVNPHSIEALKCFYVDLSHVKPLFPEVVMFFARSAGFTDGRIFYPTGAGFEEQAPWNQGEYALIATI